MSVYDSDLPSSQLVLRNLCKKKNFGSREHIILRSLHLHLPRTTQIIPTLVIVPGFYCSLSQFCDINQTHFCKYSLEHWKVDTRNIKACRKIYKNHKEWISSQQINIDVYLLNRKGQRTLTHMIPGILARLNSTTFSGTI